MPMQDEVIRFTIHTKPKPQARPRRATLKNGRQIVYSPKDKDFWKALKEACAEVKATYADSVPFPLTEALQVDIDFYLPRPKRIKGTGRVYAPVRPDRDNLDKAVLDGLVKEGILLDDNIVVDGCPRKFYTEAGVPSRICVQMRRAVLLAEETKK